MPAESILLLKFLSSAPTLIADQSARDSVLSKVLRYLELGWPDSIDDDLRPYHNRRNELSLEQGCVNRIVIPSNLQPEVLEMLHEGHVGIVKTKSFARRYVYWPGIDKDIEQAVRVCNTWPLPGNKMVLVIIDAHSKWIDAFVTGTATSSATIEKLRASFSTHGLPDTVVSDNGTCFTSKEFKDFMEQNGVRHITVAPYRPSSNGIAEKAVNIVKDGLKHSDGTLESKLLRVLFKYRATPHTTTRETPSKLSFQSGLC
ncbi:uncharacterized protein K02A2.6 [Exaiptasia diaphana]|uniref:Integrase catalytic domain-containing protein n=1 Tax=Exaiptasia diaphana TaxID=2652724 RepID=A0A913XST5_EXADI|nr:uncharacterized protein K02A2.6 [Exaiptasia diaphana]KXJ09330.1 Uncharacterized protein K02A2.6 [Exaiptasia diaphana]